MRYAVEIQRPDGTWFRLFSHYSHAEAEYQAEYERNRDPGRMVRIIEEDT